MIAARVKTVVQWGVLGVLHRSSASMVVPVHPRVRVGYDEPDITQVLVRQSIVELYGVRPVDLREGVERAGLLEGSSGDQ